MLSELLVVLAATCIPDATSGPEGVWCGDAQHWVVTTSNRISSSGWQCLINNGYYPLGTTIRSPAGVARLCQY